MSLVDPSVHGSSGLSAFNPSSSPSDWSSLLSRSKFCTTNAPHDIAQKLSDGKRNPYLMLQGERETVPLIPATLHPWSRWGSACNPALSWSSLWTSVSRVSDGNCQQVERTTNAKTANWWQHGRDMLAYCTTSAASVDAHHILTCMSEMTEGHELDTLCCHCRKGG